MAFLVPESTSTELGLVIKKRLIPDSARATRNVASYVPKGAPMKPCKKLSNGTGKVQGVTIHNTGNIKQATGTSAAEQYSRATWPNQAMGGVMVHYYVDEEDAWQNLRDDEQGWHAADGAGPGNTTTVSIEIIMDGTGSKEDVTAERNGAKLAAILLHRHGLGIDKMTTHNHWYSKKYCPAYILPHWPKFVEMVKGYLSELSGGEAAPEQSADSAKITPGSVVTIKKGTVYGGLNATRGKPVSDEQLSPKRHTVDMIAEHNGQTEARLREIFSWVPVSGLTLAPANEQETEDMFKYTLICGEPVATAAQMRAYLRLKNPDAPDYVDIYLEEGAEERVRGDIAFAQSCVETGCWKFGGDVSADQNNFAGIGAVGGGQSGNCFDTPRLGIKVQIQHLKCYASTDPLVGECVDPRWGDWLRGKAPYVEWLGQQENPNHVGWAAGKEYGATILKILQEIISIDAPEEETVTKAEYLDLKERYETLWKRYDALTDMMKKAAADAKTLADNLAKAKTI